ncbi:hypothetical protein CPB84DRAFT_1960045 [Gymnopilus junonius]|uniref:Uncharacterized protein n=1 Tax=Gymnopilus junonius TaxID=109634 RepID=A0A9P5NTN6_GYMJU|nr:hypothetical protein CPB84DRAFT_1960045 [Gymnopilus junonius]
MASNSTDNPSSTRPKAAARLLHSVKRTLSPSSVTRKRYPEYSKSAMRSTNEESRPATPLQPFRDPDPASTRPTIEQIAMGLHISRTPHLRPLSSSSYPFSQRGSVPHSADPYENHHHHRATPVVLPPPPSRPSLKKPSTSSSSSPVISPPFSSASSTTVTSMSPSSQSPRSTFVHDVVSIVISKDKYIRLPPKKAVRFTTEEVEDPDQ